MNETVVYKIKNGYTNRQCFLPQAVKRNFLRRTKATAPPDTTETTTLTDNTQTTTDKFTRRGNSKFKPRKEVVENKVVGEKTENGQRTSLNGGARRSERPTPSRKFVRRRPGGANPNPSSTTTVASPSSSTAGITRRPFRIASRRRPPSTTLSTTTTTTTPAPTTVHVTTAVYEDEESLQDISDIDAIEDPSLENRTPKAITKIQRRPLISLQGANDQNPSATNEEEKKRQSKKYSASIKQNQLDDLLKSKSQEEDTTEKKTTDEYTAETALAIAAHQLITAPVPGVPDVEEDITPSKKSQTTVEYKYTSREYNEYTDNKTPSSEEYQSTPIYRSTLGQNYDQTTAFRIPTDFDSPKITTIDFEIPQSTSSKFAATPTYTTIGDYRTLQDPTTSGDPYTLAFEPPKISTTTYSAPNSYLSNNPTTNQEYIRTTTADDYSISSDLDAGKASPTYVPKSPTTYPNTFSQDYIRTTEGEYSETPKYNSRIPTTFNTRAPSTSYPTNTDTFVQTTGSPSTDAVTEYPLRSSLSYVPKFPTANQEYVRATQEYYESTELNSGRISTTYAPTRSSLKYVETTLDTETPTEFSSPRVATTNFAPRSTVATRSRSRYEGKDLKSVTTANVIPVGFSRLEQRLGSTPRSRSRGEKLIPVTVEDSGYSTARYSSGSQEPSYFTREYFLESPVTKTYDEEYQYLSPMTSPQTPQTTTTTTTTTTTPTPRKVVRKKIQRKISTTQRPTNRPQRVTTSSPITTPSPTTTPLTTTVKPRRVPSRMPFEKISKPEPKRTYKPIENYDYYDDGQEKLAGKYAQGTKVVLHSQGFNFIGNIECLDIGNFPHPTSCKKFISCAKMENGGFIGWEYVCPQGLSFDPVGGICNWSAGLGCNETDA